MLSGTLYDNCISSASVKHDVDNLSNDDPTFLHLHIDIRLIAFRDRVYTPRVSWVKASDSDLDRYRSALSQRLRAIQLPAVSLLCTDMRCKDASHHCAVGLFAEANYMRVPVSS